MLSPATSEDKDVDGAVQVELEVREVDLVVCRVLRREEGGRLWAPAFRPLGRGWLRSAASWRGGMKRYGLRAPVAGGG